MPYLVIHGSVRESGRTYKRGEFTPGAKGSRMAEEAVGAVEWVDSPPRESAKRTAPAKVAQAKVAKP